MMNMMINQWISGYIRAVVLFLDMASSLVAVTNFSHAPHRTAPVWLTNHPMVSRAEHELYLAVSHTGFASPST
jgi:hypothetical protein